MSIYLDNAATSFPKPECVYAAVDNYMRNNGAAFGRGLHDAGDAAARIVAQCRNNVAQIIGAASDQEIAFTFNCTDGINLLLYGLLAEGDCVVTSTLEHNSVLRPLQQLKLDRQIEFVCCDFDPVTGLIDAERMADEISRCRPRLVVLSHGSNVTGIVQPVKVIAAAARNAGAILLLDAAQTAGHYPFNVQDLGVDLLATAGHKGLLGPLGTGVIYVRREIAESIRPVRCGGTGTASESPVQPLELPFRFESGNLNMPGLAGLHASTQWLLNFGIDRVHQQISDCTKLLRNHLHIISCVTTYGDDTNANTGIVSFTIDGTDCRDVAAILNQSFAVQCRAGLHCAPLTHRGLGTFEGGGTIRLSPGVFTSETDINVVGEAVQNIAESFA